LKRIDGEAVHGVRRIDDEPALAENAPNPIQRLRIEEVLRPQGLRNDRHRHVDAKQPNG